MVPPGDHYSLTFTGTKPFGQYIDDQGNTAAVPQTSCDSVVSSLGRTDTVVSINGSSMMMTFDGGSLDGTYSASDGSFDTKKAAVPQAATPSGITTSIAYESKGTLANGSMTNAAIREIINEQPNGASAVSGGCDFLFTGTKV